MRHTFFELDSAVCDLIGGPLVCRKTLKLSLLELIACRLN